MKIRVAKNSGFCFGVKRAIETAFLTLSSRKNVYIQGDIVHNEDVVNQLRKAGIRKTCAIRSGKGRTLIIRAHGAPKKTIDAAVRAGYTVVDATCPMVKGIHRVAQRMEKDGRHIIIIGDKDHDEVQGIIGQLASTPYVINKFSDLKPLRRAGIQRAAIVVQSTQDLDKTLLLAKAVKGVVRDLIFNNTICNPTKVKQKEAKVFPLRNDVVLIVGSKTSANTKRLYEISRDRNQRTYWINSADEICPGWFDGARSVGIMAGASTPEETVSGIISRIRAMLGRARSF